MGKINDGESAFPISNCGGHFKCEHGMTLRQWYVGQALAGFCSSLSQTSEKFTAEEFAKWAVGAADAVIVQLNKDALIAERNGGGE